MLSSNDRRRSRRGSLATAGLVLGLVLAVAVTAATVSAQNDGSAQLRSLRDVHDTQRVWTNAARPEPVHGTRVASTRGGSVLSHWTRPP